MSFFFFNDTATTEIYTLSLHDALPISILGEFGDLNKALRNPIYFEWEKTVLQDNGAGALYWILSEDRKSTRLNSSHGYISYAVFCLKKKKHTRYHQTSVNTHR